MSWEQIVPLLLAAGLGGLIGLERQLHDKPAGLRTNILICLGSAVFTLVSKLMAAEDGQSTTRIAAQVVTGIGFLGAGAIIRDPKGVHGLTTAARSGWWPVSASPAARLSTDWLSQLQSSAAPYS